MHTHRNMSLCVQIKQMEIPRLFDKFLNSPSKINLAEQRKGRNQTDHEWVPKLSMWPLPQWLSDLALN